MSPEVENRLTRLETQFQDYLVHSEKCQGEMLLWVKGLDEKIDSMLIREAERVGEVKESRRMATKVAALVSIVFGTIINTVARMFTS